MEYQFPLIAINRNGETRIFNDADSFREFAFDRKNGGVGGYWMEHYGCFWGIKPKLTRAYSEWGVETFRGAENNWIVRDNCGKVVNKKDFEVPHKWTWQRHLDARHAASLGLPIPHTGKGRRWRSGKKWTKNGRNGAYNRSKGLKLYEDPKVRDSNFDEF